MLWELSRESHDLLRDRLKMLGDDCGYRRNGGFVLARDAGGDGPRGQRGCAPRRRLRRRVPRPLHGGGKIRRARVRRRLLGGGRWRGRARRAVASPGRPRRGPGRGALRGQRGRRAHDGAEASRPHGPRQPPRGRRRRRPGRADRYPRAQFGPGVRFLRGASARRQPGCGPRPAEPCARGGRRFRVAHGLGLSRRRVRLAHERGDLGFAGAKLREPRLLPGVAPSFATAPLGRSSGTLATTPDGLPLVGPVPGSPLVVMAGLGTRGHSWAFLAARWVTDVVAGEAESVPLPFRASRFERSGTE